MADAYEVAEPVEVVTTAPDGKAVRHRFRKGVHANPGEAERAVLEETLIPQGLATRRRGEGAKRGPGRPRKTAKRAQKATEAPPAPPAQHSSAEAPSVAHEGPSGPISGSGADAAQSQEGGR